MSEEIRVSIDATELDTLVVSDVSAEPLVDSSVLMRVVSDVAWLARVLSSVDTLVVRDVA